MEVRISAILARLGLATALVCAEASAQSVITVHDLVATHQITPYMTGACIEDVNHEIYGGLYSQMVFGESFQEPAQSQLQNFSAYGGNWGVANGAVSVAGTNGPKIVLDASSCANCEAGVEVNLGANAGPSGLLLHVSNPGLGPDRFFGYEISLGSNLVRIGKHENNYTLLRDIAYTVPTGQWVTLRANITGATITVFVNGINAGSYTDASPLPAGSIGLRAWLDGTTGFRSMWVNTNGSVRNIAFTPTGGNVSGMWNALQRGTATGTYGMNTQAPFKGNQSQNIAFTGGNGEIGIENQGLNRQGMSFIANQPYEGYVWVRAAQATDIAVALEKADGSAVYAEATVRTTGTAWARLDFTLTPTATVFPGRFAIKLKQAGTVAVGHAFLQPGAWGRYQGLPVRKDVVDALVAQRLTVMRYGGSMVNHGAYRWKNMIGPRDQRPMTDGHWYPYSSNGWAIFDFLDLTEKMGILGIPDVNSFETAQDMADFVEYANGAATTTWGARRAADGHPAPYNLRYLQIGNEEAVNTAFASRFQSIATAIWAKDPNIILVVGDFGYDHVINDPNNFTGSWSGITSLAAHKQILDLARANNREVWFDIHINTNAPPDPANIPAVISFSDQLGNISPGARYKLVCFELNTFSSHSVARALANANAINALERIGDRLAIVCSANCLQVDGQNDNGWDQGLVFMNPERVWAQPPYYVTQMAAAHYLPSCLTTAVSSNPGNLFNITATKNQAGNQIVLKVVNGSAQASSYRLAFDNFVPAGSPLSITTLAGAPNAVNTAANPTLIAPSLNNTTAAANQTFTFPANSYTVLHYAPVTDIPTVKKNRAPTNRLSSGVPTRNVKGQVVAFRLFPDAVRLIQPAFSR